MSVKKGCTGEYKRYSSFMSTACGDGNKVSNQELIAAGHLCLYAPSPPQLRYVT